MLAFVLVASGESNKNGQANLFGIYHGLSAPAFPATVPVGVEYIALVRGSGLTVTTVRLIDPSGEAVFSFEDAAEFAHAPHVRDALIQIPTLTYPVPGWYRWEVVCGAFVVSERPVLVEVIEARS